MSATTKKALLLALLRNQYVTPLDALNRCGIFSLAQRISEWRAAGHLICDKWTVTPSGARVKAYRLLKAACEPEYNHADPLGF